MTDRCHQIIAVWVSAFAGKSLRRSDPTATLQELAERAWRRPEC